ncbi:MAG TPA: lipoyl(octanoyl) transferase LipB [Rhizomicrobium sp.]
MATASVLYEYRFSTGDGLNLAATIAVPSSVEWRVHAGLLAYPEAVAFMEQRVAEIADGTASELVWLVEHPPIYTAGTSARDCDLLDARFPVFRTGRGGQFTYHGPGQRVIYVLLNLNRRRKDAREFVRNLEQCLIDAVAHFGVRGERRKGRVGIWVGGDNGGDDKIAAIGVRLRRWVTFHGAALNVSPNLEHFAGIVPCGIRGHGITSLAALGVPASMAEVDATLKTSFDNVFGYSGVPTAVRGSHVEGRR